MRRTGDSRLLVSVVVTREVGAFFLVRLLPGFLFSFWLVFRFWLLFIFGFFLSRFLGRLFLVFFLVFYGVFFSVTIAMSAMTMRRSIWSIL
jgi:hypothetical protein